MLEKVNAYLKEKIHLPPFLKKRYGAGICSLEILPQEISLCYLRSVSGELQIQFCESFPFEKISGLKSKLTKFVKLNNLTGVNCSWVLSPDHYQLIMTEVLPVSKSEFQTAIRWKIKESLGFPIEDAVIDQYQIPQLKVGGDNKMTTVVVARKSYLQPYVTLIKESGLRLTIIDIEELALHNLTALYEEDDKTSALICIKHKRVQLLITYHQKLYLSRFIDINLEAKEDNPEEHQKLFDRLILEIQRSFDYFQSQWRMPLPTRIFLASMSALTQKDADIWTQKLSLPVQLFDINNILSVKGKLPISGQGKYLAILGGVLRGYVEVHETAN